MTPTGLARLHALKLRLEQMRAQELSQCNAALADVVAKAELETEVRDACMHAAREALVAENQGESSILRTSHAVALVRLKRLRELAAAAEAARSHSAALHQQSRVASGQLATVLERERSLRMQEAQRAAQAEMDDRFAARAAWQRQQPLP